MPRRSRFVLPEVAHHVTQRGNNRQNVFFLRQPVRAGLSAAAWEWRWSSARGHCVKTAVDTVLDCDWIAQVGGWNHAGWRENLANAIPEEHWAAVRHATRTGEPLGSSEFVTNLERQAGRRLRVLDRGRPRKRAEREAARKDNTPSPSCFDAL
jgi:hypothetical protein